jgi:hypothetical protein
MINLLPDSEKVAIHKEYRLRIFVIILWMLLALIILAALLLSPSYVLSVYQRSAAGNAVPPATEEQQEYQALVKKLKASKVTLGALKPQVVPMTPTHIIELLTKNKTSQNTINSIQYSFSPPNTLSVTVRGIAKNRQSLIDLKTNLEKEEGIDHVELPVSNLAKDANIEFSFDIRTTK